MLSFLPVAVAKACKGGYHGIDDPLRVLVAVSLVKIYVGICSYSVLKFF